MNKEEILTEIAEVVCSSWMLEVPYIKFYGWHTCFFLDDESITIDDDLLRFEKINVIIFALVHELSHYITYNFYKRNIINKRILKHPHNTDFCVVLYTNLKILNINLNTYIKNAIEYPVVKKILKELELNDEKTKKG